MQFNRLTHPLINKYFSALSVVFLFFLSLLMMFRQLTTPAYFSIVNNDAYSYSSWAFQLSNALREGIIYPRWMPLDFAGYGSPTFVYYPPLSFYIVAFFNIFTDSTTIAMNITRFLSLFLSGTGLFFLGKEIYSERSAAVAAVFYLLLPYNVMHFYLLGSFASSVSFMWFSPILLGSYKYVQTDQFKYLAYAGICYSGLILTHVINAYMFTFVVLAFIVFLFLTNRKWNYLFTGMLMLLAGVSLSAAYVLPLAYEKNLINVSGFLQGGSFYFAKCFIQPHMMDKAFVNLFWPFNYDTFAMFALVIFYCCIAFIFIISIYKTAHPENHKNTFKFHSLFFGIAITSIFLMFAPSKFVWEYTPFFKYIHFPFRWFNITAFAITLLFASFLYTLRTKAIIHRDLQFGIVVLFLSFIILDYYYISHASTFSERELIPVRAENSSRDHKPVAVDMEKLDWDDAVKGKVTVTKGEGKTEILIWKSAERIIEVEAGRPLTARIRTFNFPGWSAYVDGASTDIKTETGTGAILLNVPTGKHRIRLVFGDTPVRLAGKLISLCTALALIIILTAKVPRAGEGI